MDLKQIKQIIELMKNSELTEFEVEDQGFKLKIKREPDGQPSISSSRPSAAPFPAGEQAAPVTAGPTTAQPLANPAAAPNGDEADVTYIKSPMVGTFYLAPSPESKPFATPGTKVVENTPVCIIEAMKIMNEIQAEVKGTILEILVENGQPVEYGQRLFKVKKG